MTKVDKELKKGNILRMCTVMDWKDRETEKQEEVDQGGEWNTKSREEKLKRGKGSGRE